MPEPVEISDVRAPDIVWVAAAIVVAVALAVVACWLLLRTWQPAAGTPPRMALAAPRLQTAPQDERAAYVAEKDKLLHSYQWLDREAGTVRIPIETAMDVLTRRQEAPRGGR